MSVPQILTIATPTQLARTLLDHLNAPVTQVSVALESVVLTSMNAQRKRIIVQSMLPAWTLTDPSSAVATQAIQETAQFV